MGSPSELVEAVAILALDIGQRNLSEDSVLKGKWTSGFLKAA